METRPGPSKPPAPGPPSGHGSALLEIPVANIRRNQSQPRKTFVAEALDGLASSIKTEGIVQPVLVRRVADGYELISGERRWRAAQKAGLASVPCLVVDADDNRALQMALIENLQREDLNPIELGAAFENLVRRFNCTQEVLAERIGMDRSSVANYIRLLDLPSDVQESVSRGTLTMGHARALLAVDGERDIRYLARRVETEKLSVRKLENIIRLNRGKKNKKNKNARDPLFDELEGKLREILGTTVRIDARKNSGVIVIDYYDLNKLNEILERIGVSI